ncbi:MAG TPA: tRNA uridine-5-carboxymethylaminomethyl(34) synthesis GTPase MnmE [Smithellaceae bacterium]|jgi:tRNA modification GTPase|nr:tRNA uridine-5-carboxymethylaminomethyl(34) synthesis GTPase MnmE [Smithellaceae bacterium]MDD3257998.1 tRNA uridine-5-carboxymethylaminomethyl(34) synthesis GTPase MnmE [Smithellaceae bacterium]HOG11371.1 tRNA uridine-5-carboxymethylaminomethyl(34) synthesis GTPase MnmE [Smithellaceae bacterium]HOQ71108.1 tRNA uridine-5-carboxymethylaminomethyl(34) synthesis GTPase MnmE [Smithellaceae bacterium]HPL09140.1 tRNA uridine-5-carboxymethylaminomethyl(34) synthesis GTPase MnmE [Smithellaceae bacte
MVTKTETIAAIATPSGTAGVGLIRVSGPLAPELAQRLFRPAHSNCTWQSHHCYHGDIIAADGKTVLDEVLATLMRKPRSFTGEDVLEISCHGNPLILQNIMEQFLALGCRPARPGEFSERAYLNGRMDLSQAEALAAMICAQSAKALQLELSQLKGSLGNSIDELRSLLIDGLANLEAAIDFTEDVSDKEIPAVPGQILQAAAGVELLLSTYRQARLITQGIRVVIVGKPNTGKSSLLNRLAGKKKAIVTDIPGTTRDLITETITLDGISIHLTDTAGIRPPRDDIEKEGISLVRQQMEQADILLLLFDGSQPLTDEDYRILEQSKKRDCQILTVVNKRDLAPAWDNRLPGHPLHGRRLLDLSAKFGDGVEDLKKALSDLAGGTDAPAEGGMISRLRHKLALEKALACLKAAQNCLATGQSSEFAAFELSEALNALDEITGKKISEDVLSRIFSGFCIGK